MESKEEKLKTYLEGSLKSALKALQAGEEVHQMRDHLHFVFTNGMQYYDQQTGHTEGLVRDYIAKASDMLPLWKRFV